MSYSPDRQRLPRVIGSSFFVGMGFVGIVAAAREQNVSGLVGVVIFAAYLLFSSVLITSIVSRLYRQHGIRHPKFDLTNLILLTVLIALPFALSNTLWDHFLLDHEKEIQNSKTTMRLIFAGVATFMLLPVFLLTEALLSWHVLIRQSFHKPSGQP